MTSLFKVLHVTGATLFLGNIVVSAVWKTLADRTGSVPVARFACRLVNLTDLVFTGAGATLLIVSGHLLAGGSEPFRSTWILQAYALAAISGLIWLAVLVPIQVRQTRMLRTLPDDGVLPASYLSLSRLWALAGIPATILPWMALYPMLSRQAY
jgi:uncharacterized membrane protein